MAAAGESAPFAERLRELKEQSGQSYAELSKRVFTSRSTLHRYCTGRGVPPDPETVTRIGKACDASAAEIRELLEAWINAAPGTPAHAETSPGERRAVPVGAGAGPGAEPPEGLPGRPSGPRRRLLLTTALGVILALVTASTYSGYSDSPSPGPHSPGQERLSAVPNWAVYPKPVEPQWFGVTVGSDSGKMPSFRVGAARLWNSRTRWSNLEPRRGVFEWATLDRLVAGTERAGLEATYVIGGTPAWAAPDAPVMPFLEKPRATGPDNLRYWDRFVRKLVDRYGDRIRAYELWDLADEPRLSRETPERLVEMTRRASRIIKSANENTYVICPGMTVQPNKPKAMRMFRRFAELGGYSHCDGASIKQSQHRASDPPEGMLVSLLAMAQLMRESGVGISLWNTGPAYDDAHQAGLDQEKAANHAARFFLTGLYGRTFGMRRMYFYSWGTATLPITLQDVDGPPTRAARHVERLQDWLAGARIRSCGHGAASRLPATVWKCEFIVGGRQATIMWTHAGRAHVAAPPGVHYVRHLDGTSVRLQPGGEITVTERPAFITPAPAG